MKALHREEDIYNIYFGYVSYIWAVMLFCVVASCHKPNGYESSAGLVSSSYSTPLSDDAKTSQTATTEEELIVPSLVLESPEATEVVQGKAMDLKFTLDYRRTDKKKWVVVNYGFKGGRVKDNTSSELQDGKLEASIIFTRPNNFFSATVRDVKGCTDRGVEEEDCLGKLSIKLISKDLEKTVGVMVGAKPPPEEIDADVLSEQACMSYKECRDAMIDLYKEILDTACEDINPNNLDFSVLDSYKWAEILKIGSEYTDDPSNGWLEGLLAAVSIKDIISKDENTSTKSEKEAMRKKYEGCKKGIEVKLNEYKSAGDGKEVKKDSEEKEEDTEE
ncbi:MAG: hypothetical protein OXC44_06410 [Proteobacteria bacterium]|nr:hypothetical protein [Pseudomonadota bacterium]